MACKQDVKAAILNKVMDELAGRYTYSRVSGDTVMINSTSDNMLTVAKHTKQAKAIAHEVAERIEKSFQGHVKGEVSQFSKYDPVLVKFTPSDKYIDHVYNNLPYSQQTDSTTLLDRERDYINNNSGPNSHEQLELFSVDENVAGTFTKYIQFKQEQLTNLRNKLSNIQAKKKRSGLTTEELTKLNNQERDLKLQIEGSFEFGIKGLKQEINELKEDADINAIGYYVEKDLQRIATLANSSDILDLREAQRLIDFYTLVGTFERGVENPFFEQDEIFLEDENGKLTARIKIAPETVAQYKSWGDRARDNQSLINKRHEEISVDTVNSDPSVKRTYGDKEFVFNDLISSANGLRDVDWISMWTMDITNGLFSNNGMIPQVMFSFLANSFEKRLAWARGIEEKIDKLNPKVQSELIKKGHSLRGGGIVGLKGASYQLFKEITKEGSETGGLVQRFVKEFFDGQSKALNDFSTRFDKAITTDDYGARVKAFNKAFEDIKKWRRNNTIIMDITKLPEFSKSTDDNHKKELIDILGQKGYEEQVKRQQKLLNKYEAEKQSMIDTAMNLENVTTFDALSEKAKSNISYWEHNHSPYRGLEDFTSVTGIFFGDKKANNFMDYNNFIPRKYKPNIVADVDSNVYRFTDTKSGTGFYSEAYNEIENNPILSEFYDVVKEVCDSIRENMPYEMQQKMAVNTVPALQKTVAEIIADKNTGVLKSLFTGFRHIMERVRLGFGVTKQSEISYATIDPITGKANYKVNDQFIQGNSRAVSERLTIEKVAMLQAINSTRAENNQMGKITRFTSLPLASLNEATLLQLAKHLHLENISVADIRAGRIDDIRRITGEDVQIGKYIRDYSLHTVVQTQSFDLAKIAKYFSNMTMAYAARQEALPILEVMKSHYESIKKPKTNNLNAGIYNANNSKMLMDGLRVNSIKQMEDWFNRVALGNYDTKHLGEHGNPTRVEKIIGDKTKGLVPRYFNDIYSIEDKKKLKEIDELLRTETDEKKAKELTDIRAGLGRKRTATAIFDSMLGWIRTLRLGYNVSSATTNFLEGVTSNMILGSLNEYFDPKEIYYGYSVMKHSFLKNITFGKAETGLAKRNRSLMDKFNVVMDSKNELQRSSNKTYADKLGWMNPHAINQRVEYMNQSPIMIAMLRTLKIKDKNGVESSVWDAYQNTGHLKEDFRTEENIKNWEELVGEDYLNFKQKLHKAIVLGHGNYDELRGMMIKSNTGGKALAMFKTWLPMQFYWRFATEQDDIQSGTIGFKGRYWSYGKGSGLVHGAVVGTAIFGLPGLVVGGLLGAGVGKFFGRETGIGLLQETISTTKALLKKTLGMPVNLLAGRQIVGDNGKIFDEWVGKGNFTIQDAKNMRGNMADIALQLAWIGLMLMVKSIFWDDEDEKDDADRQAHNILVNKLMQLSSQAAMYSGDVPGILKATLGDNAVAMYLGDLGKEVSAIKKAIEGDDIIPTGIHAGESALWNQTRKIALPGLFKDKNPIVEIIEGEVPTLGFKSQSERVFEESPFHKWFKDSETIEAEDNKEDRSERRKELEDQLDINAFEGETREEKEKARDKELRRILDTELPTPAKLKKLEQTREEYEASRLETQE